MPAFIHSLHRAWRLATCQPNVPANHRRVGFLENQLADFLPVALRLALFTDDGRVVPRLPNGEEGATFVLRYFLPAASIGISFCPQPSRRTAVAVICIRYQIRPVNGKRDSYFWTIGRGWPLGGSPLIKPSVGQDISNRSARADCVYS